MFLIRLSFISLMMCLLMACHEKTNQHRPTLGSLPVTEAWLNYSKAPLFSFTIVRSYPHNPKNFTEGLFMDDGNVYESTGLYQQSTLQKYDLTTGKVLDEYVLPAQYFAEGIAVIDNHIYQLTYQEHTGFIYDKNTFKLQRIFHYPTEGWGLTSDGKQLIMSDGSATLFFINPTTLTVTRTMVVTDQEQPIYSLNELEYIHGEIYANIWPTDIIAIISPQTGKVEGWINIHSLNTPTNCKASSCAANGIAYLEKDNTLLVTGKNWSHSYVIRLTN